MMIHGDCVEEMSKMEENSIDSIVSDPPYGLGFMGKDWDEFTPKQFQDFSEAWGLEALRVLKPGGYCLAFSGTRTYHRMVCGLEDAGFKIITQLCWLFGSGFPKALNISKKIDEYYGKEREVIDKGKCGKNALMGGLRNEEWNDGSFKITKPNHPEAQKWEGWYSQLKPAMEPIVMAQKPYEKTYANNVLKYGVGGLNIDRCRIQYQPEGEDPRVYDESKNIIRVAREASKYTVSLPAMSMPYAKPKGRFPSNVLLTHHAECVPMGVKKVGHGKKKHNQEITRKGLGNHGAIFRENNSGFDVNKCQGLGNYGVETINSYACHPSCPVRLLDEQSGNCPRFFKVVNYNDTFIKNDPLSKIWLKKMLGDIIESQKIDGIVNGVIKETERFILNLNTDGYGNRILVKYLKDMLSTIKILSNQIINSKISNYYQQKNIENYIISLEKTINSLDSLNIEDVQNVKNIDHLQNIIQELRELIQITVKNVQENIIEFGERKIENTLTNTQGIIEKSRFIYSSKAHKSERNAMNLEGYPIHYELKVPKKKEKIEKEIKEKIEHKILSQAQLSEILSEYRQYFVPSQNIYWKKENDDYVEISLEEWQLLPKDMRAKNNSISTLKPINIMRYLIRLVTPKGGTVLDPFAGSGTTGIAAIIEGFNYVLIEKRERFAKIIIPKRLKFWSRKENWNLLKDHQALPKVVELKTASMEDFF